ncbi:SAM-dependent methyltransferase [Bacillus sp. UMB0899]|uniref:class I SAM-dependent methyltransferase n=1 Tax=Metabacillus schmidteae TaxID=2730405 RepID=UPI000C809C1D|nr:class I SAM-dependent methyltransferase [Metabacillus schmidteae]PMC36746.1 SAM-dependent methyltransferase [Bacillus sp. UMB0899]
MTEKAYDQLLNIDTDEEQKGFHKSFHYHRYEPTPYQGLEQLFQYYKLTDSDRLVDFGCGKGRLPIFVHHLFHSPVAGVEMDNRFYEAAVKNRNRYITKTKKNGNQIVFHHCLAEEYPINPADNRFYFFNPFSVQIFMKVIRNILQSVEKKEREVELILYYAAEEYLYYLDNKTPFILKEEMKINGLYEHNPNERFLIYHLESYED